VDTAPALAPAVPTSLPASPDPPPRRLTAGQRVLEVLPGVATWGIILALVVLPAVVYPTVVVGLVIVLDVYWFVRSIIVVRGILQTFRAIREQAQVDWWQRCLELKPSDYTAAEGAFDPRDIYHAALVPTYTEKYEVLLSTVSALAAANYPAERKIVAIITRTTDTQGIENVQRLQREFEGRFAHFWHILDPLLPGIVVGKSAAMAYGGPELYRMAEEAALDPRRVIVTDLDSDFRIHPEYLAWVTHQYSADRGRDYRLYQPVPMFHNNLWRVPAVVHVMASSATQWQMFLHTREQRLVTFASYSMSLHLVRDVGYWDPHVIQEDSRFFWRCFFRYGERLRVVAVPLPIYGDCPRAKTYSGTHASQYNQIKRWAWGVSDVPFVFLNMMTHPEIPLWLRVYRFLLLVFNHLMWVGMPLLLLFGASIPGYLAALSSWTGIHIVGATDYSLTHWSDYLGLTSGVILTLTLVTVGVLIYVDETLVPPRPPEWSTWRRVKSYVEILAYPFVGLFFSVIPALESQTRLMFGFYLEYRVTEKE
jgi:cellulose synthase/poly-beta-1,6-N-acetylglucosamine synthase-like glycosyltransferase